MNLSYSDTRWISAQVKGPYRWLCKSRNFHNSEMNKRSSNDTHYVLFLVWWFVHCWLLFPLQTSRWPCFDLELWHTLSVRSPRKRQSQRNMMRLQKSLRPASPAWLHLLTRSWEWPLAIDSVSSGKWPPWRNPGLPRNSLTQGIGRRG